MSSSHGRDFDLESKTIKAAQNEMNGFEAMSVLLDDYGDKLEITEAVVKTAARNERSGAKVLALLLEKRGDEVKITEEVVKAAAENRRSETVLALLLEKQGGNFDITENLVSLIAGKFGRRIMALLLEKRGDEVMITEEVVKAAAGNEQSGLSVLALLLEKRGDEVMITEEVVKAAAGNWGNAEKVLALLLEKRGDEVMITEEVVKAAAENWRSGEIVLSPLLETQGGNFDITENLISLIAGKFGMRIMAFLLEKRGDEVMITGEVVKAAAGNEKSGEKVLALLLEKRGDEVMITEEVVKAAAGNKGNAEKVLALLLEKRGDEVMITEEVVKAAAGNEQSGQSVLALLLEKRGDEVMITEEVVKAAAENWGSGEIVLSLLLEKRGDEVMITEEVVKAAAGNKWSGESVLLLLLWKQGGNFDITENLVSLIAGKFGRRIMALLLEKRGDEVMITEEVVKAAAGNEQSGLSVLALLLEKRGDEVMITEEVVKAAAGNKWSGEKVLTLLEKSQDGIGIKAKDEHIWIRKLQRTGYSLQEIANLLFDEEHDSPWIYFEPAERAQFVIHPNRHVPRCSHYYCSDQQESSEDSRTWLTKEGSAADDYEDVIEIIEELCGLAGISPTTRTKSDWFGSVDFNEGNHLAAVSYTLATDETHMLSVDRLWSRISQALEKFCCAAGLIQSRNLCCNSFTFLRLRNENHEAPAKIPGEVVRVDFQLIVDLAEALRSAQDPASEKSVGNELLAASEAILILISPIITDGHGVRDLQWCLQLCALAVQFLCLGFLSFTKAHIGAIHPFFLDAPLRQVTLQGLGKEEHFPYIVAELTELTCLGGMTRGPVLMFYAGENLAQVQDPEMAKSRQNVGQCDILGRAEDVLDTWGPGNFVFRRDMRGPPVAIKIGDGFIFANKSGKCHWARGMDDVTDLDYINLKEPLLIGAFVTTNTNCGLVKAECWKKSSHVLEYLGTMPSSWAKSQQQVAFQCQYVVGQLAQTWNKQRGIAVKEMVLSYPDNEQLIQFMDEYWGVQI